jgi:hypothetical protein
MLALVAATEGRLEAQGGPPYFTDDTGTPGNGYFGLPLLLPPRSASPP